MITEAFKADHCYYLPFVGFSAAVALLRSEEPHFGPQYATLFP